MANLSVFKHFVYYLKKAEKKSQKPGFVKVWRKKLYLICLLVKGAVLVADYFLTVAVCICKEKFSKWK